MNNNNGQPIYYHHNIPVNTTQPPQLNQLLNQHQQQLIQLTPHPVSPFQQVPFNPLLHPLLNQPRVLPANPYGQLLQPITLHQQIYRPYAGGTVTSTMNLAQQQVYYQNIYNMNASSQFVARNQNPYTANKHIPLKTVKPLNSHLKKTGLHSKKYIEVKKKPKVLPRPPNEPSVKDTPPPPLPAEDDEDINKPKDPRLPTPVNVLVNSNNPFHKTATESIADPIFGPISPPIPEQTNSRTKVAVISGGETTTSQEETENNLYEISLTTSENKLKLFTQSSNSNSFNNKLISSSSKRKQKSVELYGQHHKKRKSLEGVPLSKQNTSSNDLTTTLSTNINAKKDNVTFSKKKKKSKKRR